MAAQKLLHVDPATLRLPGARRDGADLMKLQRQLAKHGTSIAGMPPLEVNRGTDGELMIYDGVTRATRVAVYPWKPGSSRHFRTITRACGKPPNGRRKVMTSQEQTRTELLGALAELGRLRPEWRLGQTLANVATTAGRMDVGAVWDLEDDEALVAVRVLIGECHQEQRISA